MSIMAKMSIILNICLLQGTSAECPKCFRIKYPYYNHLIESFVFLICASVSGYLYYHVIATIKNFRKTRQRARTLSRAFACLWLFWIICTVPSLILAFVITWKMHSLTGGQTMTPDFFFETAQTVPGWWDSKLQLLAALYPTFRALKHAYGFINSLLLIVLLRPFHEPLTKVYRKITS
ncbi:uncharacterized protein LOC142355692 [Convolutriloba macropyga]|uniref:uncharacterized protein LOC142355692 n=1 Tax=Convolutriloba macropyga TaxID=536237 RepID=UPI003F51D9FC